MKGKNSVRSIVGMFLILMLLQCLLIGLAYTQSSLIYETYIACYPMMLLFSGVLLVIGMLTKAKMRMVVLFIVLQQIALCLQVMLAPNLTNKMVAIIGVSIISAILLVNIFDALIKTKVFEKFGHWITFGIVLVLYALLFIKGVTINGTKAWLAIGSYTFQLTELIKLISLCCLGCIYSSKLLSERNKFLFSFALIFVNAASLVLVNELGTLLILLIVYFLTTFLFLDKKYSIWNLMIVLGTVLITGIIVVMALKYAHLLESINLGFIVNVCNKVYTRFMLIFNPELVSAASYQSEKMRQALIVGGMFGSSENIHLPAAINDLILTSLVMKMGIIVLVVVSIVYILFTIDGLMECMQKTNKLAYVMGMILILVFSIQFLLVLAMNCGVFPLSGIGLPIFSFSGSMTLLQYFSLFYIMLKNNDNTQTRRGYLHETTKEYV